MRYQSKTKIGNWPLISIALGPDLKANESRGLARGIIAVGDIAVGCIALGGVAIGFRASGGLSIGYYSHRGLAIGVYPTGGRTIHWP